MSVNDDITKLLDKVLEIMSPEAFLRYISEYRVRVSDMFDLERVNKEFLEFAVQFVKGEISFKELTLLMNPMLREGMKDLLVRVINEVSRV